MRDTQHRTQGGGDQPHHRPRPDDHHAPDAATIMAELDKITRRAEAGA